MINILLVDENTNVRRGVRMRLALESDFTVVGEASDGWEALQLVRELQPHIVVTGVRILSLDGIALTERIRQDFPNCIVIILSLYDDGVTREKASKAGAAFFVSKKNPNGELIKAIRAVVGKS